MEQLKKTLEEKDTKKLLPPEIVWSTVDLPSVIEDIATQQAELTLMSESTLEEVEENQTNYGNLWMMNAQTGQKKYLMHPWQCGGGQIPMSMSLVK